MLLIFLRKLRDSLEAFFWNIYLFTLFFIISSLAYVLFILTFYMTKHISIPVTYLWDLFKLIFHSDIVNTELRFWSMQNAATKLRNRTFSEISSHENWCSVGGTLFCVLLWKKNWIENARLQFECKFSDE